MRPNLPPSNDHGGPSQRSRQALEPEFDARHLRRSDVQRHGPYAIHEQYDLFQKGSSVEAPREAVQKIFEERGSTLGDLPEDFLQTSDQVGSPLLQGLQCA